MGQSRVNLITSLKAPAMHSVVNWVTVAGVVAFVPSCSQPPVAWKLQPPFIPVIPADAWTPQDVATNVRDWDRAAIKIAEGLASGGLLGSRSGQTHPAPSNTFMLKLQQNSMFLWQLKGALETEITSRGGSTSASPSGAITVELSMDVVLWGSRSSLEPYRPRQEGVWQAKVLSGERVAMSFRQPFYLYDSDLPLYQEAWRPDLELAQMARPLRYGVQ